MLLLSALTKVGISIYFFYHNYYHHFYVVSLQFYANITFEVITILGLFVMYFKASWFYTNEQGLPRDNSKFKQVWKNTLVYLVPIVQLASRQIYFISMNPTKNKNFLKQLQHTISN